MKKRYNTFLIAGFAFFTALSLLAACRTSAQTVSVDAASDDSPQSAQVQVMLPDDRQWQDSPNIPGAQSAPAVGNPAAPQLYAVITKMTAGTIAPAHYHPEDRVTTVLSGVMYYGTGEKFNRELVQPYPAGSVVFTPAGTPHFMWTETGETIMQETGFGPTGMTFTSP